MISRGTKRASISSLARAAICLMSVLLTWANSSAVIAFAITWVLVIALWKMFDVDRAMLR